MGGGRGAWGVCLPPAAVEGPNEDVEEIERRRGQVHHDVLEDAEAEARRRAVATGRAGRGGSGGGGRGGGGRDGRVWRVGGPDGGSGGGGGGGRRGGGDRRGGGGRIGVGVGVGGGGGRGEQQAHEGSATEVVALHVARHLVGGDVAAQPVRRVRVEVVGVDLAAAQCGGHSEGADARHHVAHHLVLPDLLDHPPVLALEATVPVDLAVVELECGAVLAHLGDEGGLAREQLHREDAQLIADALHLVHHRAQP